MYIRNKLGQFAKKGVIAGVKEGILEILFLGGLVGIFISLVFAIMTMKGLI